MISLAYEQQMELNFQKIKGGKDLNINKKPFTLELIDNIINYNL